MFQKRNFLPKLTTRQLVLLAVLVALQLVIARFSVTFEIFRISFGFLVTAVMAWWFGPLWAGLAAVIGDLINALMIGVPGGYFPGFTLSAFLGAFIYGLYFYRQQITWLKILLAVITVVLIVNLGLNSWWVAILSQTPFMVHFTTRAFAEVGTLIVHFIMLNLLFKMPLLTQLKNRIAE